MIQMLVIFKTVPIDLKKLSDVVSKKVENTVHKKLNTKVGKLETKILDTFTLIQTNQQLR